MKIVDLQQFFALPAGVIFGYYEPCIITGLMRKGDTILSREGEPIDFFEATVGAECPNGDPPICEDIEGRWGVFDQNAQFVIYELADLQVMAGMINAAIEQEKKGPFAMARRN